jgi:hypothetical protein
MESSELEVRQETAAGVQPRRRRARPLTAQLQTLDRERNLVRFVPGADIAALSIRG